ncbi:MAG: response regulator [Gloeomargarita sp. SKYBB_i_bin120]|nr:response regulator [Gloeomargarita sp. SKYG98]MCS7291601.1 response regulator [Gloeomargarita sp. SKYB120]MDW8177161.1 response regulator [Gloeomargarita sp. SKYBB_i_bin120]
MPTVLLVEDVQTEAALLASYLQGEGFLVQRVASAEEAHAYLAKQKPDLIVLDVVLPGESGFELCRRLKKQPETASIPVIICSSKQGDIDKFWGMKQGASAYLTKPVNKEELIRTARSLVGRL